MEEKPIIHIVAIQCEPGIDKKFNKWYDEIHVPMIFKFKGMKEATRYKIVTDAGEYTNYLAIYKFESQSSFNAYENSPELAAARAESRETWKEGGRETKWRVQYELLETWEK